MGDIPDFRITFELKFPNGAVVGRQQFEFFFNLEGLKRVHYYWMSGNWSTRVDHDFDHILEYMTWGGILGNFRVMPNGTWWIYSYAHNDSSGVPDVNNIQLNSMILWDAPKSAYDSLHLRGKGRIVYPRNPLGKELNLNWWAFR